jgi:hypothetical protein
LALSGVGLSEPCPQRKMLDSMGTLPAWRIGLQLPLVCAFWRRFERSVNLCLSLALACSQP